MAGVHSLRFAKDRGRMLAPFVSMRNITKAWGRQQRNRALQRVVMNASPPSGSGQGYLSWKGPSVSFFSPVPSAFIDIRCQ